jgi:hypothetical protein
MSCTILNNYVHIWRKLLHACLIFVLNDWYILNGCWKKKLCHLLTLYDKLSFYAALKITKTSVFHYLKTVYLSGFLDSQEWLAHFDDGNNSLHKWSESARRSSERYRLDRLELGHRERGRWRFRSLRMPDQHRAKKE